jgi:hypothetical protein
VIWAQASVARASQTGPEMFIGTIIDITEAKCAQESLLAMQSELARISQLLSGRWPPQSLIRRFLELLMGNGITLICAV